jgi:hypothetical protein
VRITYSDPNHVAVDLDDVTVDFMPGLAHSYELEFGEALDISAGTWAKPLSQYETPALRAAGFKSLWDWLRHREWLWALFPAVPGAMGGIAALRHAGWYVEAVTSKPEWAEHNVWKWLGKWRPPFNRVTIVGQGQEKVDVTVAGVIIDDKLSTCVSFNEAGRSAVLFDRYGAHEDEAAPFLRRAQDWNEVIAHMEAYRG